MSIRISILINYTQSFEQKKKKNQSYFAKTAAYLVNYMWLLVGSLGIKLQPDPMLCFKFCRCYRPTGPKILNRGPQHKLGFPYTEMNCPSSLWCACYLYKRF